MMGHWGCRFFLRILLILSVFFVVSGCQTPAQKVSEYNKKQISNITDRELCIAYRDGAKGLAPREVKKRNLGDCSEAHIQCAEMGITIESEEYLECRKYFAQIEAMEKARRAAASSALMQTGFQLMNRNNYNNPTKTSCTRTLMGFDCNTWSR